MSTFFIKVKGKLCLFILAEKENKLKMSKLVYHRRFIEIIKGEI